jgi:hypothetical protein
MPYHAFLIGLPTQDLLENAIVVREMGLQQTTKRQIQQIFKKVYGITIQEARSDAISKRMELSELEANLKSLRLKQFYDGEGARLDSLTESIKSKNAVAFAVQSEILSIERVIAQGAGQAAKIGWPARAREMA